MTPWWTRAGLEVRDQRLLFAGHDAERIAREHGTPLYVYDPERVTANVGRLRAAFTRAGVPHRIHYALKANRHPEYLARLRSLGDVGIDALLAAGSLAGPRGRMAAAGDFLHRART